MESGSKNLTESYYLLQKVADNIKLPLIQILHQAQLGKINNQADLNQIEDVANFTLKMIDNYILGLKTDNDKFDLEPLSLSSVLYDSAKELEKLASHYGVKLEVSLNNSFGPVLSNRLALEGFLMSVGWSMIESVSSTQNKTVTLATHKCRYGVVAGVYANDVNLNKSTLKQGTKLLDSAKRSMPEFSHTSGSGIFVAEKLLNNLDMKLLVSKHHNLRGIGTLMNTSKQLQLV